MPRTMGLDVGDKTIGVALSDLLGWTAQGLETIQRTSFKNDLQKLEKIIQEYDVNKIIVGLPKNMDGTIGPQGQKSVEFAKKLKNRFNIEVVQWDERLTTVSAERMLVDADVSRKKRKSIIDKVAAAYILQGYLDKESR